MLLRDDRGWASFQTQIFNLHFNPSSALRAAQQATEDNREEREDRINDGCIQRSERDQCHVGGWAYQINPRP